MITIKKVLSNNVVIAVTASNQECVLSGKGIAHGLKNGGLIDETKAEKIFKTKEKGMAEKLSRILDSIPIEFIKVGDEIINMAQRELGGRLNEKIYLTLIDHVYFAIDRHMEGVDIINSLFWEMQQFYNEELQVGLKALDIIEKRMQIRLPNDEAAFLAFHFVNAGSGASHQEYVPVQDSIAMIKAILVIVDEDYPGKYSKSSHLYNRFVTHLKYFSLRVFGDQYESRIQASSPLYKLRYEFPAENDTVEKIAAYVKERHKHQMSDEEKAYILIHLHTLLTR